MYKNYLKWALRNLVRRKAYATINILGLAVALASVILILVWVDHELSYDGFHERADSIFLILRGEKESFMAPTSGVLAPTLIADLPEVVNASGYTQLPETEKFLMRYEDTHFEEIISFTDARFFEIFSFPFLKGSPASALGDPNSLVMTENTAKKYFGAEEAFGKTIQMYFFGQRMPMRVTGILEDIPFNTHFNSEIFVSFQVLLALGIDYNQWHNQTVQTYILTGEKPDLQSMTDKIVSIEKRYRPETDLRGLSYRLLPLKKIHLHGKNIKFLVTTGDIKHVYIFAAIAFIILMIASVNYMNLSTAQALKRAREIGVRKAVGAGRKALIEQFLGETLVLSFMALFMGVGLAQAFLPAFNHVSGKALKIPYFDLRFVVAALCIAVLTGLFSGYYPALFLSAFHPVKTFKARISLGCKGLTLRKGLVIFQFSLSIILIISTIIVFKQLLFMRHSSLGYDSDHILCIRMTENIGETYDVLRNELLKNPDILGVSRSEPLDANVITNTTGVDWEGKAEDKDYNFRILRADPDFAATYGMTMDEGRFYSREFTADAANSLVINEAAARVMGLTAPVGKQISLWGKKDMVIGVLKDFHFGSLHTFIEPLIVIIPTGQLQNLYLRLLSVRFRPGTLASSMTRIKDIWQAVISDVPFDHYFLDDAVNAQYGAEQQMGTLFQYFTAFAIFIACLGLYGLASYSAEQKIKEIGIRKVLGANVASVTVMLSKDFLKGVVVANLIAWPVSWFVMTRWLQNFAYRASVDWWVFVLAGGLAFGIALVTVSFRTVRSATANPADALRYE